MDKEIINTIGKWVLLLGLVGAAIYFAFHKDYDVAGGFGIGAFWLFMVGLLD